MSEQITVSQIRQIKEMLDIVLPVMNQDEVVLLALLCDKIVSRSSKEVQHD